MPKPAIILLIVLAFLLRAVALSSYPTGFTPDEASFGYDAYSLLKTGRDQWGETLPLTLRSFGDFKLPLYAYLTIPSIAIFGLNELATRLPNAIFGTLAVLATYLLSQELFKNKKLSFLAALLLAISPWHIALSRGAFEANLTTFFLPFGVWAFLKGKNNPWWLVVSAFCFGLNLFTYHSARLITPLIVLLLVYGKYGPTRQTIWKHKSAVIIFSIFFVVAAYTMFFGAGARGADIAIFNPTDKWASVADRRYEAVLAGLPDFFARLFSNKLMYVVKTFLANYSSYLSPQFLFTQGAGEWTYGMIPGRGVLYLIESLFVLISALYVARGRATKGLLFIFLWILLSPIPGSLTKGPGHAGNRIAVMMPALQIFSAYGAILLMELIGDWKKKTKKFLLPLVITLSLLSLTFFLEDYIFHAPKHAASSMLYGRREAIKFASSQEDRYSTILVSRSLSEPHIYVAFYKQWNPKDYQTASVDWLRYEKEKLSFLDQLGTYSLGKYLFQNISFSDDKNQKHTLLIGKPGELPRDANIIKKIDLPDNSPAIYVVDPSTTQTSIK
ncbi:MAG: hypothetical protein A3H88_03515 [Candidatus Blackburnbacteria bacterium RIFCSPLOWO2_02_FULL_44_9]|uniref:Glycosyltransferase RgtA/B/C/D-like domain-containing protein n=1 Tax=Candidatus Blackburnbacteria bacterium RIFCSPHIGHO2_02_FULL_44_20 TaxID=1797516 RepID=A0A1G1V8U5_9BACT|nr:MAG: hypothetical protein A3E16_01000 [Candidatus Blackburnbacteria bacterium RIFCSPHIGHO2_12_FULL_44_25]OGY11783.1 MAG: hypothetical protein A3D26_01595 [Candidatus Blackburnbacteria bacterium RIFCSPHIGHO2_02_FULL_44_20]OGY15613.1 MAG: hypothetical protein A3H88_03515 [Candidatus Blackburnbacteria bacterium RIFCSPLOWO2_02_FULL_44_9]